MKRVVGFILLLIIFYALWKVFSANVYNIEWLAPLYSNLNLFLATSNTKLSAGLLNAVGFEEVFQQGRWVMMDPTNGVVVTNPCLGIGLYWMFIAFVISFPTTYKAKLWFVPLGLLLIFGVHVFRIAFLGIIYIYYSNVFVVTHLYISRGFLFGMTILFCFLWVTIITRKGIKKAAVRPS